VNEGTATAGCCGRPSAWWAGACAGAKRRGEAAAAGDKGFYPKLFLINSEGYISPYIYREDLTRLDSRANIASELPKPRWPL